MVELTIAGVLGLIIVVAVRVAAAIMSKEVVGWIPKVCAALLASCIARLPPEDQERWSKEWAGEVADKEDRPITALFYVRGIRRTSKKLAAELYPGSSSEAAMLADEAARREAVFEIGDNLDMGLISRAERDALIAERTKSKRERFQLLAAHATNAHVGETRGTRESWDRVKVKCGQREALRIAFAATNIRNFKGRRNLRLRSHELYLLRTQGISGVRGLWARRREAKRRLRE